MRSRFGKMCGLAALLSVTYPLAHYTHDTAINYYARQYSFEPHTILQCANDTWQKSKTAYEDMYASALFGVAIGVSLIKKSKDE